MKTNKVLIGLMALIVWALYPVKSMSQENDSLTLSKNNVLVLNAVVDGESVGKLISQAKELDAKLSGLKEKACGKKHLILFLNTPGGSIQTGLELIEALKGLGRPVDTITLFAASMGFQIAQNMDTRYIIKNGVLMSHRAKGGFEGEFGGQAPSQIESRYALWKSRLDELDAKTVSRTAGKKTLESYQKQYSTEMWLTGNQSVEQGYADKVVSVKCDSSLKGSTTHELLLFGMFRVSYELDNCPINTSPQNVQIGFTTTKGKYMNDTEFAIAGGSFGASCLTESATNKDKLCALDTSLNMEKIRELKVEFLSQYANKQNKVVDMP